MAKGHRDKIAVITGAASGIGQAFAKRLAEEGAHIVIADIQPADETARMVEQYQRQALPIRCDVSSPELVKAMAKAVHEKFGRCDILVNNAGIYPFKPFLEMAFEDWRHLMGVNLDSAFLTCSAFIPGMKERRWGRIVNMASATFATVVPRMAHYIASKGGVVGLTRALASEFGNDGITINAIGPGLTRTPGVLNRGPGHTANANIDDELVMAAGAQSIKRPETPDDLVGAIAFLTGDDAAFITGQTLYVDGGKVRV